MTNYEIIMAITAAIGVLMLIWLVIVTKRCQEIQSRYKKLLHGASMGNIEQILLDNHEHYKALLAANDAIRKELAGLSEQVDGCVQRIALKRYNPFEDVGGDLSFSAALLNDSLDGVILTSIYSRRESQMYAKPVKNGRSEYRLSSEEQAVLDEAGCKK